MHHFEHDYSSISSKFNIITLEALRSHSDLSFRDMYQIIIKFLALSGHCNVDCGALVEFLGVMGLAGHFVLPYIP